MRIKAFITHKLSESYSECQDRFSINESTKTIAVSDGMSESVFPDYWADILSKFYADNGHCTDEDRKELCKEWLHRVEQYKEKQIEQGKNPWRLSNNLLSKNGAGATICGITFDNEKEWHGNVLGDSCVIEIDSASETYFIIHTSENKAFDKHPDYYESFPEKKGRGEIKAIEGCISETRSLIIVSDPFADFISKSPEKAKEWMKKVKDLKKHSEFSQLIDDWRQDGLHNDDSTLCVIEFDGKDVFEIVHKDEIENLIEEELKLANLDVEVEDQSRNTINEESGEPTKDTQDCRAEATTGQPMQPEADDKTNVGEANSAPTQIEQNRQSEDRNFKDDLKKLFNEKVAKYNDELAKLKKNKKKESANLIHRIISDLDTIKKEVEELVSTYITKK